MFFDMFCPGLRDACPKEIKPRELGSLVVSNLEKSGWLSSMIQFFATSTNIFVGLKSRTSNFAAKLGWRLGG